MRMNPITGPGDFSRRGSDQLHDPKSERIVGLRNMTPEQLKQYVDKHLDTAIKEMIDQELEIKKAAEERVRRKSQQDHGEDWKK